MNLSALVDFGLLGRAVAGHPIHELWGAQSFGAGRSFKRENSLQGGADQRAPRIPLDAARRSKRNCASSKMSNAVFAPRSKGCRQSACSASIAAVRGALTPAKRSRKSFGAVDCLAAAVQTETGSSDELDDEEDEERRRSA